MAKSSNKPQHYWLRSNHSHSPFEPLSGTHQFFPYGKKYCVICMFTPDNKRMCCFGRCLQITRQRQTLSQ